MKTYIYILFLLAALVQPLLAQDAPATKSQPPFPTLPFTVTTVATPTAGGTVELFVPSTTDPVSKVNPGVNVTLKATPTTGATNYKVVFGYPKVYCTKAPAKILEVKTVPKESDDYSKYTFTMPNEPVTVEVKFEEKLAPSSDAHLKALKYKIGTDTPGTLIPVPDFTPGTKEYTVTLPSSTADDATVTLSGTVADAGAHLPSDPVTTTLSSGSGSATLTVTAENGTTADYTVNFVKAAADKYIVTIASVDGGTITVTDAAGKVINSGDAVANGTVLTLTNTAVAGYEFSGYTNGTDPLSSPVTIESDIIISAEFTPPTDPKPMEDIGTPAVTDENPPAPTGDAAVVIIPDAGSLPEDTELSQLRLIKEAVDESKETEVKQDATEAATAAGITVSDDKMVLMEVTLVKVTTTTNPSTGVSKTTVTPVQPADKVKVRIPYPEGVNKDSHDITIIHLKLDGSTEVYSGGDLTLADDYMEIIVTGFSPFVVAYVDKPTTPDPGPDPGPTPDPDPTYYTVTLPAVEGATTDPAPGNYEVKAWDSFTFYLTLDKDYDQSVPVVTTDEGKTITPRASDGAYLIKYVHRPITISIAGIKKNTDVANETIASGLKIWTEPSALCLDTDRTEEVRIITVAGSTAAVFTAQPGLNRRPLPPGLYIVQTARKVSKVIVR